MQRASCQNAAELRLLKSCWVHDAHAATAEYMLLLLLLWSILLFAAEFMLLKCCRVHAPYAATAECMLLMLLLQSACCLCCYCRVHAAYAAYAVHAATAAAMKLYTVSAAYYYKYYYSATWSQQQLLPPVDRLLLEANKKATKWPFFTSSFKIY